MIQMSEAAVIVPTESFHYVTMSECCRCFSLQPCVSDATTYRCADWHACQRRQVENQSDTPTLTPADYAGLLARMETQQADMERLKRIESAAITFVQARDVFNDSDFGWTALGDMNTAAAMLALVVKGGTK